MLHIAILNADWGMLPQIAAGIKTIESRWLNRRVAPWNKVDVGDTVYFKNSGQPVTLAVEVSNVIQIDNLTAAKVHELLTKYHLQLGITKSQFAHYYQLFAAKKFVVLMQLENMRKVKPFQISKQGFPKQAAWLTFADLQSVQIPD